MGIIGDTITNFEHFVALTEKRIGSNAASIVYIMLATITYVVMLAWCRLHANEIPTVQAQSIRGVLITVIIYLYSQHKGISLKVENRSQDRLRILRNVIAGSFNIVSFFMVTRVPMSTLLIIQSSSPFIIAFIDHFFYKTTYTKVETIFSFVSLSGVIFMIKPDLFINIQVTQQQTTHQYAEGTERILWIALFVTFTILWSGSVVMLKALRGLHPMAMNFPFGIFMAASSPVLEIAYEQVKNVSWNIYLQAAFFLGIVTFINQHTYVKANQLGKPAKLAMLNNTNVVMSFLFEIMYLGEHREWYSFVGATVIVGSSIILSISRLQK